MGWLREFASGRCSEQWRGTTNLTRRLAVSAAAVSAVAFAMGAEAQERHPKIRAAIRALEAAKNEMQQAAHDFGGHRVDALKACDEAIHQLQIALQYDKK